ncbi:hypothetical protein M404DRAFT_1008596 [Pisolithus tinctorius Marx 270]|uniref:Uncharacterized protein n=1 Tax=Pisolithus tinctorius Marx 270 TaxID=870435 RepID=A0A0C3J8R5_PISTI|nr:hypothetical protein M404DRAFT_1008596 [Pisolithus tinctorius Marx 270]
MGGTEEEGEKSNIGDDESDKENGGIQCEIVARWTLRSLQPQILMPKKQSQGRFSHTKPRKRRGCTN